MTKLVLLAALALSLTGPAPAHATLQAVPLPPHNVTVDVTANGGDATGNMAAAHNGAYPSETVWCYQVAWKGGAQTMMCGMTDANGVSGQCSVVDPNQIALVRSIKPDSQIKLSWYADGYCQQITVTDSSVYAPKAP